MTLCLEIVSSTFASDQYGVIERCPMEIRQENGIARGRMTIVAAFKSTNYKVHGKRHSFAANLSSCKE